MRVEVADYMSDANDADRRNREAAAENKPARGDRDWPTWLVFVAVIAGIFTFLGVLALLGVIA